MRRCGRDARTTAGIWARDSTGDGRATERGTCARHNRAHLRIGVLMHKQNNRATYMARLSVVVVVQPQGC